jgi:hypothetical protein
MTAKSKSREPRSRKPDSPSDIEKRIRQRAYELYDQRGRVNGFALDDWLRAEAAIRRAPRSDPEAKPSRRRES